jgi:hypothetical protein
MVCRLSHFLLGIVVAKPHSLFSQSEIQEKEKITMNPTKPATDEIDPVFNSLTRYQGEDPRARRGFNYGAGVGAYRLGEPCADDSWQGNQLRDKGDCVNFRHDAIPDRDDARKSNIPNGNDSSVYASDKLQREDDADLGS